MRVAVVAKVVVVAEFGLVVVSVIAVVKVVSLHCNSRFSRIGSYLLILFIIDIALRRELEGISISVLVYFIAGIDGNVGNTAIIPAWIHWLFSIKFKKNMCCLSIFIVFKHVSLLHYLENVPNSHQPSSANWTRQRVVHPVSSSASFFKNKLVVLILALVLSRRIANGFSWGWPSFTV